MSKNPSVQEIMTAISNEENILFEGVHGVGKTYIAKKAAEKLNYKTIVFDSALIDPYVDLLGIPQVVENDNGKKILQSIRKEDLDDVQVIVFDEANRAQTATLNGIMGLIQFHALNGVPLPNLKAVIATQNPSNDKRYVGTKLMDAALRDRFDREYILEPEYSTFYYTSVFGNKEFSKALVGWVNTITPDAGYISPRRLEKLGKNFMTHRSLSHLSAAMPTDGKYSTSDLFNRLNKAVKEGGEGSKAMPKAMTLDEMISTRANITKNSEYIARSVKKNVLNDSQLSTLKVTISTKFGNGTLPKITHVLDVLLEDGGKIPMDTDKYFRMDYNFASQYFYPTRNPSF